MSSVTKDQYGRQFGKMMAAMAVLGCLAIALNLNTLYHNVQRGSLFGVIVGAISVWVVWVTNRKHIWLALNRARVSRRVSLRCRVTRETPGFERLVRVFPYHDNDSLGVLYDWDHKPHLFCRPRRQLGGFRRAALLTKIFERKFKRLDPEGISYVEATTFGYGGRNMRVWFRSPTDAVAFKLRYSDDLDILDLE